MKIAILANDQIGFIRPMSLGLQKMFALIGVQTQIFTDGLAMLDYSFCHSVKGTIKNLLKGAINVVKPQQFVLQQTVSATQVDAFEQQLKSFDLVVVVCHIPTAFMRDHLSRIEHIRSKLNIPVLLYQNYYLATRGDWTTKIKADGGFGLERFDWYLAASAVSDYPLKGEGHRLSVIGHDLRCDELSISEQKPFTVLLDFERKGFEAQRTLQIKALQQTNTPYTQLVGRYNQQDIRQLYCQHSALFLSFRESFGLPIIENQLCGNFIFTPQRNWAPSHFINKSLEIAGDGALGDNFMVYDNDLDTLKRLIEQCKVNYQAKRQLDSLQRQYPQFYHGDIEVLQQMLSHFTQSLAN
jgi:hypothetical protein